MFGGPGNISRGRCVAGHGAEGQTFVGGLSFMSFSFGLTLDCGNDPDRQSPMLNGYRTNTHRRKQGLFLQVQEGKRNYSAFANHNFQSLGLRATGFNPKLLAMADGPTARSRQIRGT